MLYLVDGENRQSLSISALDIMDSLGNTLCALISLPILRRVIGLIFNIFRLPTNDFKTLDCKSH